MPATAIYASPAPEPNSSVNALPQLLHTPLGTALLEIQGTLNMTGNNAVDENTSDHDRDDAPVGRLEFPLLTNDMPTNEPGPWMKKVYFYVGKNQRLVGEVKKLPTALAVLRRRDRANAEPSGAVDELEIVDVVQWKLYFGSRPEFV